MERKYHTEPPAAETTPAPVLPTIEMLSAADTTRKQNKLLGELAAIAQEIDALQQKADGIRHRVATETYSKEYPTLSKEYLAQVHEWGEQCKREMIDALDQLEIEEGIQCTVSREIYHDLDMAGGYTEFQELTIQRQGTAYYLSKNETYKEEVQDRYNEEPRSKRYVIDANSNIPYAGEVEDIETGFDLTSLKGSEWRNVHYDVMLLCSVFAANTVIERALTFLGNPDDPDLEVKHNHSLHIYKRMYMLGDAELRLGAFYRDQEDEQVLDTIRILLVRDGRAELECSINAISLEVSLQPKQGMPTSYQGIRSVLELLATIDDRMDI